MRWRQFFTPINGLDPESAREYMDEHKADSFTLLDVRQPKEYESSRLAGAILIPLPELQDRLNELDPGKPLIVY
jgi:rhodanese-related sulfurtransferase